MNRVHWIKVIAFVGCAVLPSLGSEAHDARGVAITHSDILAAQLAKARLAAPHDADTRSVLDTVLLWPVPRALTICFVTGSPVLRGRVTEAMLRLWPVEQLTSGRLKFDSQSFSTRQDCGANPNADIRVAFQSKDGYWSYVGVESRQHVPSLNLQDFSDTTPSGAEFDRLVGHETGHALGLEHEHQSPGAPDCMWNFPYIFSHYSWKSDADMHYNLDRLQDQTLATGQHAYTYSLYDQASLMHYYFEPQAFTSGTASNCYIKQQSSSPSQQDLRAIRDAYGEHLSADQTKTKSVPQALAQMLNNSEYLVVKQLIATKASILP
jgi:hypothetical protein